MKKVSVLFVFMIILVAVSAVSAAPATPLESSVEDVLAYPAKSERNPNPIELFQPIDPKTLPVLDCPTRSASGFVAGCPVPDSAADSAEWFDNRYGN